MKLKENESIISDYIFYKEDKEQQIKSILTNRRLIFLSGDTEENYPLSKITSVKIEKEKSDFRTKVLGFSIIVFIALFISTGVLIFGEDNQNWMWVFALLPLYGIAYWLFKFGMGPDKVIYKLVITQLGGVKKYSSRETKKLKDFIDSINETLI